MPKTYPDELAEWVKGRQAKNQRQDKHVVAFLAVKGDVQAALDAGYAMKTIWEHMQEIGRLHCRYETFTQHVKRYIKAVPAQAPLPAADQAKGKPAQQKGGTKAQKPKPAELKKKEPSGIASFNYNPKMDDKDLF